jgi:hypothetical protein
MVQVRCSAQKNLPNKTMDLTNEVEGLLKVFGLRMSTTASHGSFDGLVRRMIEMDDARGQPTSRSARRAVPTLPGARLTSDTGSFAERGLPADHDSARRRSDCGSFVQSRNR